MHLRHLSYNIPYIIGFTVVTEKDKIWRVRVYYAQKIKFCEMLNCTVLKMNSA